MSDETVRWGDDADEVIRGDLTVAAAYVTPAGGVVAAGVSPCGLADRDRGTVGFTTALGFGKKLERIVRDPHVALAYHARDHGFATSPRYVLAQGTAAVDLEPSPTRLRAFGPQVTRFLGELKQGPVWDRLLREYYAERVFVDVDVARVVTWPDLGAAGEPDVDGRPWPSTAPPQSPPRGGVGPRIDVARTAGQVSSLAHRLLAWRGGDGFPVVVPVALAGHDAAGLRLVAPPGILPAGGRRAGLLAHSFRPKLIGLATRMLTGWLSVADDGAALYAPHTSKGFMAPPRKNLLLFSNGLMAKVGYRQATRSGAAARLRALAGEAPRS
ncbi:MAG TPA: hypothetical protein VFS16_04685 [Acidimicrobiia bacterium]|nr:hypothetical protein [Acidimicrobiia bacterium]